MNDKPLDAAERDLLAIIAELHATRGAVDRATLNVEARGRGIEVGRALSRLKEAGFVEDYDTKPGFLRRLFGGKSRALLRPTARPEGPDAESASATTETAAPEIAASDAAAPETPAVAATAPETLPAATALPEPAPPALPAAETATDAPAPAAVPAAAADAEMQSDDGTAAQPLRLSPAEPDTISPDTGTEAPRPRTPAPLPPTPRFSVDAYTEDLGGGPGMELAPTPLAPDMLDDLRETLGNVGMELTMAGETLIADRIAQGALPGDALSQVALYAFAHAVHYDLMNGGGMQALGLTEYAIEVMRELEKLRDAGAIDPDRFEADMRQLWSVVEDSPERGARAAALLADPIGGAAPPALLPEDLQTASQDEDA